MHSLPFSLVASLPLHLPNLAAALRHPNITVQSSSIVLDLVVSSNVCLGIHVLQSSTVSTIKAPLGVVLAGGGLGGIYSHTTNPSGFNALGSSVALATRAGAITEDLEYVQFHPTSLYIPGEPRFLLSEALRGEGAILRDPEGRAFAKDFHEDGELAPRDVVARGVYETRRKKGGAFLDITHRGGEWAKER